MSFFEFAEKVGEADLAMKRRTGIYAGEEPVRRDEGSSQGQAGDASEAVPGANDVDNLYHLLEEHGALDPKKRRAYEAFMREEIDTLTAFEVLGGSALQSAYYLDEALQNYIPKN